MNFALIIFGLLIFCFYSIWFNHSFDFDYNDPNESKRSNERTKNNQFLDNELRLK